MSSPIYKPVNQNGHKMDADNKKATLANGTPDTKEEPLVDTRCGFWTCKPSVMQPCANIGCFTGFYSLAALMTSTLTVYVNSQITTLERQFGFSSKQTGVIMAANDIGYLICVLFVSYSASKLHIPKSLGIATIIFGFSGVACSLPHFLFGSVMNFDPTAGENSTSSMTGSAKKSMFGDLCAYTNSTGDSCEVDKGVKDSPPSSMIPQSVATASLVIIVIGMMLQGFGKAPRHSFTVVYVDDNTGRMNTGFYMGIIITLAILGPAVAFLMGGIFSRMYVTLEATKLNPRHPKWIGAWWLGYIVFGVISLIISLPLFCFPRRLPRKEKKGKNKESVKEQDGKDKQDMHSLQTKRPEKHDQFHEHTANGHMATSSPKKSFSLKSILELVKDFIGTLFRLWTNPIYVAMVASACCVLFSVAGSSAYAPKYLERMFDLPAFKANYIMAGKTLFAACVGTFIGGYLSKRMKMTAMKALKFIIAVVSISLFANCMGFVFQCDQPVVHNWPGSEDSCSDSCHCEDNNYFAICGADGKTYYSPCHAGCAEIDAGVYQNCTCIPGGTAVSGTCDYGCAHLYPYAVFMALRSLFGTLSIIPKMVVYIRCVANKDKALAMGFSSFMSSLLGWLLGPIIFGGVIDGICTVWDIKCGVTGRCLLYDNDLFRIRFHAYGTVALICSLLCIVLAYVYARCTGCLDDPEEIKKKVKDQIGDMTLVVNDDETGDGDATFDGNNNKNGDLGIVKTV